MIQLSAPQQHLNGSIHLFGSKSLSNRYLLLAEILNQNILFENLSNAEDTTLLQQALETVRRASAQTERGETIIDIGHAGTDMRFLTAYLSNRPGSWLLTGSARMKERPIAPLVEALQQLGADIFYVEQQGFPPLRIQGKQLNGGNVRIQANVSSQFISALLLVSPALSKGLRISLSGRSVSQPYILMTVQLLNEFGIACHFNGSDIVVAAASNTQESTRKVQVESDWSSASYWYSICALAKHARINLRQFYEKSTQADAVLPELYKQLGVQTRFNDGELIISSSDSHVSSFSYDFSDCPDLAQTVAVTCLGLGIEAQLRGLSTLKLKETDRIEALANELRKFGAHVTSTNHALHIQPAKDITQTAPLVHSYNDHRMALSFAPLCLSHGLVRIDSATVVNKSYPRFWEDLKSMGFNVNLQA